MTIWGKGSQLSTQPTTASESLRQPDFTPEAIGTWAAKQKAGTVLCQAYQHNQCADNPCSMRAPTIVLRANDHICCLRYPACIHSRDIKQAKQDCWRAEQMAWVTAGSASNSGHPTVGQKQRLQHRPLQQPDISARIVVPRQIHLPDSHQPPRWHHSRAP